MPSWIHDWDPDDEHFWAQKGRAIARRNLVFSVFAELLGFSVWQLWSVIAPYLRNAGFHLSMDALFWLVAIPGLVGATMRFPYTFAVPRFGGRNWTVVSALLLLVPVATLALLVSKPGTPYWLLLVAAASAGVGGGNFASSMTNISFFYPEREKGFALGLNAAGGNLGVGIVQLVTPLLIAAPLVAASSLGVGVRLDLRPAALVWLPLVVAAAVCAWLFMDNLAVSRARLRDQAAVVRQRDTWVMSWLYFGTFGSFIGYSAGLPLLIRAEFPDVKLWWIAAVGPIVGSLARPLGGWLSDRLGGERITIGVFVAMAAAAAGLIVILRDPTRTWAYPAFLATFLLLFVASGMGNGSTFKMIPSIWRAAALRRANPKDTAAGAVAAGRREAAAVMGFTSAVAAYGSFFIPRSYGMSIARTGSATLAFAGFLAFYAVCVALVWWFYLRPASVATAPNLATGDQLAVEEAAR